MDKVRKYQEIIAAYLQEHADFVAPPQGLENQLLLDRERNHFQFVIAGWQPNNRFVYIVCLHIDIKNDKVWIWQNNTNAFVGDDLAKRGIPKQDIVLAFHAPQERPFTGFAVA